MYIPTLTHKVNCSIGLTTIIFYTSGTEDMRARAFLEQIMSFIEAELGVGGQVTRALQALGDGESGARRVAEEVHLFGRELRNALGVCG